MELWINNRLIIPIVVAHLFMHGYDRGRGRQNIDENAGVVTIPKNGSKSEVSNLSPHFFTLSIL